jgi:hypothetical protein
VQAEGAAADGDRPAAAGDANAAVPAANAVGASPADADAPAAVPADAPVVDAGAADASVEAPPAPPPPRIQVRPRVTYGGSVVLARRRWMVPAPLFPQREAHESAADFFVRANRWRLEAGIPETCYVRMNPLPDPPKPKPGQPEGAEEANAAAQAEAQQAAAAAAGEVPGYEAPVAEQAEDEHEPDAPEAAADDAGAEAGAEAEDGAPKPAPKPKTAQSRDFHKPQFMDFGNPLLVGLLGKMAANLKNFHAIFEERLPAREALPTHDGEAYATEVVVQLYFPAGTSGSAAEAANAQEEHAAAVA